MLQGRNFYGCSYRRNRAYLIDEGNTFNGPYTTRLAGQVAAQDVPQETNGFGTMTDPSTVRIRNLRTGRLRRVPIPATSGAALDLELKANGSFADLRNVGDAPAGSLAPNGYVFAIRRVDSRGSFVVARGSDIDPDSLVLRGSYIRWKQRGLVQRATLR